MASTQLSSSVSDLVTDTTSAQPTTIQNATYFADETSTDFLSKIRTMTAKQVSSDIPAPTFSNETMQTSFDGLLQKVEDQCDAFTNEVQNNQKITVKH